MIEDKEHDAMVERNEWLTNLDEVIYAIKLMAEKHEYDKDGNFIPGHRYWSWVKNMDCKYISLNIDMRDGGFVLKNRKGKRISLKQLQWQYGQESYIASGPRTFLSSPVPVMDHIQMVGNPPIGESRVFSALRDLIKIGKRDLTDPKYDGYFEEAKAAIKETIMNRDEFISDEDFKDAISNFLKYGHQVTELADQLKVSVSTVERWANGVSKPHRYMRQNIIYIIDEIVWGKNE